MGDTQHHQRHLHGKLKAQRKGALCCDDSQRGYGLTLSRRGFRETIARGED
jgi:hypothetical protein